MRTRTSGAGKTGREDGFTLLELVIVMTVIALVLAVGVSRLPSGPTGTELRATAKDIAAGLRSARGEAIHRNRETVFTLDVKDRSFRVFDRQPVDLPSDIGLSLYTAASELRDDELGSIRFFPDGSSTGGLIRLHRPNDSSPPTEVLIDWMSGRVSVVE